MSHDLAQVRPKFAPKKLISMKTPELFKEYIWLVNTIHQDRKISLADIKKDRLQLTVCGAARLRLPAFS